MSRGKAGRHDRSNVEKMKREMRRKKALAESLAGEAAGSPAPPGVPELPEQPAPAAMTDGPATGDGAAAAGNAIAANAVAGVAADATVGEAFAVAGVAADATVGEAFAVAGVAADAFGSEAFVVTAADGTAGTGIAGAAEAAASAADVPDERDVSAGGTVDLVIFEAGEGKFAFGLRQVREIVRVDGLRAVPGAPPHVVGLRNLRGEVLPVIDIRRCFRMPPRAYDDDSRMIVAEAGGRPVGVITDRIAEVTAVDVSDVTEPPASIGGNGEGCVTGIVARDRDLIMVLDAERLTGTLRSDHAPGPAADASGLQRGEQGSRGGDGEELVVFRVGGEPYALGIRHVREILRYGGLLHVPNVHPCVEGVMTVRNRLLAVIDPGILLGRREHRNRESARIVVVQAEALTYGIVVDQVSEVERIPAHRFHRPVRIAGAGEADCVRHVVELPRGRQMAMVLDPDRLVSLADLDGLQSGFGQAQRAIGASDYGTALAGEQAHRETIVTFRLAGGEYGVGMDRVREINLPDRIVGIPGTPDFIPGLASLRGDLIPLVNLRVLFGFADHPSLASAKLLVVESGGRRAGLLVDEVSDVYDVERERFEPVSRLAEAEDRRKYVDRFCKPDGGGRTVLMVNLDAVLQGVG